MQKNNSINYFGVIEQTSPEDKKIEILKEGKSKNGLSFLRFRACLQSFIPGRRNGNGRLWQSAYMKTMINNPMLIHTMKRNGGIPGENGHPVPKTAKPTIERILTIDPNNMSHLIKSFEWTDNDQFLYGIIDTMDEGPGTPGYKFMRNILQGMDPAFSARTVVPQRKNPDGTTDVLGPGRYVTSDRVIGPAHSEAYRDINVPLKEVRTSSELDVLMESYTGYVFENSDNVQNVLGELEPVMESMTMSSNGMFGINTKKEGTIFIPTEKQFREELSGYMRHF